MHLQKIISSGQTGVEILALEVAWELGITTGGICSGSTTYRAISHLYSLVPLQKATSLPTQLIICSKKNVNSSDATLAFCLPPDDSTLCEIGYAVTKRWTPAKTPPRSARWTSFTPGEGLKPCFVVYTLDNIETLPVTIATFIQEHKVETLNVCGTKRFSAFGKTLPEVRKLLEDILTIV